MSAPSFRQIAGNPGYASGGAAVAQHRDRRKMPRIHTDNRSGVHQ
jgi:hypothetical protein